MNTAESEPSFLTRCACPATAAGVLAGLVSLLMTRKGVLLTPDGWGYWEGSVSLLETQEYCYFGGQPITSFPPAFSLFLAIMQGLLGVSGRSLAWSLALLASWNAAIWTNCIVRQAATSPGARWLKWGGGLFVACFTGVNYDTLLSETLFLPLLGMMLHGIILMVDDAGTRRRVGTLWFIVAFSLALLTRHAALAMIPALLLVFWLLWRERPGKAKSAISCFILPMAVWAGWRAVSGQAASHEPDADRLFVGEKSWFSFMGQGMQDLGYRLGWSAGGSLGLLLWAGLLLLLIRSLAVALREGPRGRLVISSWVAGAWVAWLALAGLCSLAGIGDPMTGRFNWFVVVGVGRASFALASHETAPRWRFPFTLMLGILTLVQVTRTVFYVIARAGTEANVFHSHTIGQLPMSSRRAAASPMLQPVKPPDYPWINRHYRESGPQL